MVRLRPGTSATAEELQAFLRGAPGRVQGPGPHLVPRQQLPRNPAGKILKRALKEELVGTSPA